MIDFCYFFLLLFIFYLKLLLFLKTHFSKPLTIWEISFNIIEVEIRFEEMSLKHQLPGWMWRTTHTQNKRQTVKPQRIRKKKPFYNFTIVDGCSHISVCNGTLKICKIKFWLKFCLFHFIIIVVIILIS